MRYRSVCFSVLLSVLGPSLLAQAQDVDVPGNITMFNSYDFTVGNVLKEGVPFIHNFGSNGTFLGLSSGNFTYSGDANVGVGVNALTNLDSGSVNTAVGVNAMKNTSTGLENTAVGGAALRENFTGSGNTAIGRSALRDSSNVFNNTAVGAFALVQNQNNRNTAVGYLALSSNISGVGNIALGLQAGDLVTGNDNISIGHRGLAGESNAIRIGASFQRFFSEPIRNTPMSGSTVVINTSTGLIGFQGSSRRFKEEIHDMGNSSNALSRLRPVTFYYKQEEPKGQRQLEYGLIAEEVAQVYPGLVDYSDQGEPIAVRYHLLAPILLNEVKRQQRQIHDQHRQMRSYSAQIAELKKRVAANGELKVRLEKLERRMAGPVYARADSEL